MQTHSDNFLCSKDFEPAYLRLYRSGDLRQRVQGAIESLACCRLCPRNCREDRLAGRLGICKTGRFAGVSSYFAHMGEEDCLRGWQGSGTIFFSQCNLRCQFCQNFEISHLGSGKEVSPERLAGMMLELQAAGCHNINLVTPDHIVPQILEALLLAVEEGLRLPIVFNTSSYISLEILQQLDGVVDIYMPDFKLWDARMALKYLAAKEYPQAARRAIREMHRQVGELKLDEYGIAKRGILVRHLVMPGNIAGTREITRFLAREISPNTYVNIMAQYYPSGKVSGEKFQEINRPVRQQEHANAIAEAQKAGLYRIN